MDLVIIKKYSNNKLYISRGNTEPVGYINLTGMIDIIRKGKNVRVVDQVTSEDITGQTLKACLDFVEIGESELVRIIRGE